MAQLEAFKLSPSGNAPPEVIEQVVEAPLVTTVGVAEKAVPTAPVTEVGEKLKVGAPGLIISVTLAVPFPAALVAVTV
jgi:hypothetical protein